MTNLITIGSCSSAHGIKGAANFHNKHILGSELSKGDSLYLFPYNEKSSLPQDGQLFKIKKITYGHKIMMEFQEINNRTELESILPFEVKIERPSMEEGEFFIEELVGFQVIDHQNQKKKLGKVAGYYDNGVQQILEIKGETQIDLPFLENFFPKVCLETKTIEMIVPEIIEDEEQ